MPVYTFRCRKCGGITEARHGFSEPHPKTCDKIQATKRFKAAGRKGFTLLVEPIMHLEPCGGELVRIFDSPNIHYRGSGFYATDKWQYEKQKPEDYNPMED
jgi:putative FmdB family regulatory protein